MGLFDMVSSFYSFVKQYFEILSTNPGNLYKFYLTGAHFSFNSTSHVSLIFVSDFSLSHFSRRKMKISQEWIISGLVSRF
jgi:hypothetical protein